jgi:hypothetical protein
MQEIPRYLYIPKVDNRVRNSPLVVPTLSLFNPVQIPKFYFLISILILFTYAINNMLKIVLISDITTSV